MIEIDKGVPIPRNLTRRKKPMRYPWTTMEIGDSFFVEGKSAYQFSSYSSQAGRAYGRKFTLRTENGGVRCWRTK